MNTHSSHPEGWPARGIFISPSHMITYLLRDLHKIKQIFEANIYNRSKVIVHVRAIWIRTRYVKEKYPFKISAFQIVESTASLFLVFGGIGT